MGANNSRFLANLVSLVAVIALVIIAVRVSYMEIKNMAVKDSVLDRIWAGEIAVIDKQIVFGSYRITYIDDDGKYKNLKVNIDEYYNTEISDDLGDNG